MDEASKSTRTTKKTTLKPLGLRTKQFWFTRTTKRTTLNPKNQVQHWKKEKKKKKKNKYAKNS